MGPRRITLARGLLAVAALLALAAVWELASSRNLVSFTQREDGLTLGFDSHAPVTGVVVLPHVPETLDLRALALEAEFAGPGRSITVGFEDEPTGGEYSIIVFAGDEYVELVRQSAHWLQRTFGFSRPGGYAILGRRSVEIGEGRSALSHSPDPFLVQPAPALVSADQAPSPTPHKEVNLAIGVLRQLWSMPIQQGPTSLPYAEFLALPFERKLSMLRSGEFSVACQGFRDLFAEAATGVPGLRVRLVNALNHDPRFPDLVPYAHATSEVWVEALGEWVLLDPWMAITVERDGELLGADDLVRSPAGAQMQPLLEALPRQYRNGSGDRVATTFVPGSVEVERFTCKPLGCTPGYGDYFRSVTTIDVEPRPTDDGVAAAQDS